MAISSVSQVDIAILHSTLEHTDFAQARPSGGVATLDFYVFLRRTALYLLSLLTFRPLFTLDNGQVPRLGCNSYSLEITTTNRMRFKLWVVVGAAQIGRKSVGASVCSYMECSIPALASYFSNLLNYSRF